MLNMMASNKLKILTRAMTTFKHQKELPKLPVPDLDATLDKYLKSVRCLANDEVFEKTKTAVNQFRHSEHAQILQKRLLDKKNHPDVKNWLSDWWLANAYMKYRAPLPFFVSYFICYEDAVTKSEEQTLVAAKVIVNALQFKHLIMK